MSSSSVERALAVLDTFDAEHLSLSLQEISTRIGLPKATTFRLIKSLTDGGFAYRRADKKYCLSMKIMRLAGLVQTKLPLRDILLPRMRELSVAAGETVTLHMISDDHRICIEIADVPAPLMRVMRLGDRVTLFEGATGRVLLAQLSDAELDTLLQSPMARLVDPEALRARLRLIRERGYDVGHGERFVGATAVSAPIGDPRTGDRYCLAFGGPTARLQGREEELAGLLLKTAAEIVALFELAG